MALATSARNQMRNSMMSPVRLRAAPDLLEPSPGGAGWLWGLLPGAGRLPCPGYWQARLARPQARWQAESTATRANSPAGPVPCAGALAGPPGGWDPASLDRRPILLINAEPFQRHTSAADHLGSGSQLRIEDAGCPEKFRERRRVQHRVVVESTVGDHRRGGGRTVRAGCPLARDASLRRRNDEIGDVGLRFGADCHARRHARVERRNRRIGKQ